MLLVARPGAYVHSGPGGASIRGRKVQILYWLTGFKDFEFEPRFEFREMVQSTVKARLEARWAESMELATRTAR